MRADLATLWLYPDPHNPQATLPRRHCRACQPHRDIGVIECQVCGDGPMLAEQPDTDPSPSTAVRDWLTANGWRHNVRGWTCRRHHA
jgi:hypothetical protein